MADQAACDSFSGSPPSDEMLDCSSSEIFARAIVQFHSYDWTRSIKTHRLLLRLSQPLPLPSTHLWCNIGLIRCHLGEYALAAEAFDKAIASDGLLAIAWFCLGMALFQLGDFRNAERRYLRCLDCLPPEVAVLPYRPLGLRFSLHRTQIEWNVRLARLWKQHKRNHTEVPTSWCLNRLPAGRLFEARPRAEELASSLDDDPPPEAADPKGDAGVRPYPGDGGSLQGNLFEQRQKKEASDDDATLPAPAAPLTSSIPRSRRITTFPPTDYSAPSSPGLSATFRQGDE